MSDGDNRFGDVSQSAGLSSRRSPIREYADSFSEHEQTGTSTPSTSQDEPGRREGFDLDMFIKDANVLKYQCAICRMVMRDPIQTQCGHRFCSMCIKIWISGKRSSPCPVCQRPLTKSDIFPDNYAKREIMSLTVKCLYQEEGCNHLMELRHQDEHKTKCPFAPVECPNGCSKKIPRQKLEEHKERVCPFRRQICSSCQNYFLFVDFEKHEQICEDKEVSCQYCHKTYRRKDMERHIQSECELATVQCMFQRFGCQATFPRSEAEAHLRGDIVKHLSLLCNHFPVTPSIGPVKYYDVTHSASVISTLASMTAPPTLGLSTDPGFCSDYSGTSTVYSTAPNRYPIAHSMEVQSSDTALLAQPMQFPAFIKHHSFEQTARPSTFPLDPNLCVLEESTKDVVSKLKCTVEEQKQQLLQQGMKIQHQQGVIRQLETQLKDVEGRFCNGVYIWRIRDYHQKRKEAIARKAVVHHSPGFYTSPHGYKMCIRANLNGVETGTGTHLSLFVHLMQGEFDEILPWPFQGCIILSILDQSGERRDISETLLAKPGLAAFLKPTSKRNNKGFGYIEFAPLTCFSGDRYVRNDTMLVKVIVKPDELVSSSLVS